MKTVFVIDDDGLMREVLSRLLERRGYRVRTFQSPRHALPLIDSDYPDVIVSDVQMPEMTGLDLARCLRERAARTPVILMTGAMRPDVSEEAARLGVIDLFEKPIKDVDRFVSAVDRAISKREDEERNAGLDRIRMSFLTGLAHELRTPLTAIKLALESLFACRAADHRSTEGRLLAISQRNIDRIVRLVEGQLDLLQITLGDVSVARRMVSIHELLEQAAAETQPRVRKRVVIEQVGGDDRPVCFTDADRLRAVVRYLLEAAPRDEDAPVVVRYAADEGGRKIHLLFANVSFPASRCDGDFLPAGLRASSGAAGDAFETRAFHRIVASLGGEIGGTGGTGGVDIDGGGEEVKGGCTDDGRARGAGAGTEGNVSLILPVSPRFDAREDFEAPIGCLREAAMLSGRSVSLLKCAVDCGARNGSCFSAEEREFFGRCRSALSDGDVLVRGRPDGTYYLGLVERRADEIDHIVDFLRTPGASGKPVGVAVETDIPGGEPPDAEAPRNGAPGTPGAASMAAEGLASSVDEPETEGRVAVPQIS